MKRFFAYLLALCILLGMTACTKKADDPAGTPSHSQASTRQTENPAPSSENTEATRETASATEGTAGEEITPSEGQTESITPEPEEPEENVTPKPDEPSEPTKPTESETPVTPPHSHSYTGTVTAKAGCTKAGTKTFTCSCGDSYTQPISPTGHDWGQWTTTKEPTVSATGNSQRKCKTCGTAENKTLPKLPAPETVTVTQAQLQAIENRFLQLVNMERVNVGVAPLSVNAHLDSVAQIRGDEIIELFSHTRPNGQSFGTVVDAQAYPYIILGENICMTSHVGNGSYTSADKWVGSDAQLEAAASWMFTLFKNSPGHYANMINDSYEHCGIGLSYELYLDEIPMFYIAHLFGAQ